MMVSICVPVTSISALLTRRLGLHFHPAGYEILYQEVTKLIAELWPDQVAEKLHTVLPGWNDEAAWKAWETSKPSQ